VWPGWWGKAAVAWARRKAKIRAGDGMPPFVHNDRSR
jgi:hypothetical protein